MNAIKLITKTEYARHRGCAKSAVSKAIAEGRISTIGNLIDPTVADIQWERNTRARADSARGIAPPAPAPAATAAQLPLGEPAPGATDPVDKPAAAEPAPLSGYSLDRARREKFEADLAELKLREQQGDLVRVAEVRAEIARRVGQVRMNLLQVPARMAPLLAAETDQAKVHTMLDAELRAVLASVTQEP